MPVCKQGPVRAVLSVADYHPWLLAAASAWKEQPASNSLVAPLHSTNVRTVRVQPVKPFRVPRPRVSQTVQRLPLAVVNLRFFKLVVRVKAGEVFIWLVPCVWLLVT